MPAVPSCILSPVREQLLALIPRRVSDHPLGCHRRRIGDELIFDRLVVALVCGIGYERVADAACSATTLRRRRDEWIELGIMEQLRLIAVQSYDQMIGLELEDTPVDGCITKAPCGGEVAGPSPVDRAKQGLKRSQIVDGYGVPLGTVSAPGNTVDHKLLAATLDTLGAIGPLPKNLTVHLDAGYDNQPARADLAERELPAQIARKGIPAPIQNGKRWVVERSNSWLNNFGKIRRCTERRQICVDFYIAMACVFVTVRSLIRRAWKLYRWDTRPPSPRIR